ncbi:hypothetical protein [Halogeometricum borinquense]|uniref:ABC-type branched-chain amino acid transport system, periplasmic component n=1 Tax=Halogeometricum borinquense (strain ATCC 700274 / DSM 11551 / JCM 10706 / KCTC 4070 / PR3) TaxID=469382 RepID=E4NVT0_HALBP|nr:hypothetical protein [Halogeometricum borinquense]ADQ69150.1 ABC-type branched-chain amino acid transport system, periplasmic component [Halogeometricum borinquense DSM 11551]
MASDYRTTCRQFVAGTNATLTAGLAGCAFTGGADGRTGEIPESSSQTLTTESTTATTTDEMAPSASYEACMEPVGRLLTAVREGNVYPGAFGSQGPLVNLHQTGLVAQRLHPDKFGEFESERFPKAAAEKQLFDCQREKEIIQGRL